MCGAAQPACEHTTAAHIIENCNLRFYWYIIIINLSSENNYLRSVRRMPCVRVVAISARLLLRWFVLSRARAFCASFCILLAGTQPLSALCISRYTQFPHHLASTPLSAIHGILGEACVRSIVCVQYSTTHPRRRWMCNIFFPRLSSIVLVFLCDHKQ